MLYTKGRKRCGGVRSWVILSSRKSFRCMIPVPTSEPIRETPSNTDRPPISGRASTADARGQKAACRQPPHPNNSNMARHGILTAPARVFDGPAVAGDFLRRSPGPTA